MFLRELTTRVDHLGSLFFQFIRLDLPLAYVFDHFILGPDHDTIPNLVVVLPMRSSAQLLVSSYLVQYVHKVVRWLRILSNRLLGSNEERIKKRWMDSRLTERFGYDRWLLELNTKPQVYDGV